MKKSIQDQKEQDTIPVIDVMSVPSDLILIQLKTIEGLSALAFEYNARVLFRYTVQQTKCLYFIEGMIMFYFVDKKIIFINQIPDYIN